MTCGFARVHGGAAPTCGASRASSLPFERCEPRCGPTLFAQVTPGSPTKRRHSPCLRDSPIRAGQSSFPVSGRRGQCHRGATAERAVQPGFAHISHVPHHDPIRAFSIGPRKRAQAAPSAPGVHLGRSLRVRQRRATLCYARENPASQQVRARFQRLAGEGSATVVPP